MSFKHPMNGYVVHVRHSFLWCLIFGCFYLAKHGAWAAAFISFGAAIFTAGISWLIVPFFSKRIVRHAYLSKGWIEVTEGATAAIA